MVQVQQKLGVMHDAIWELEWCWFEFPCKKNIFIMKWTILKVAQVKWPNIKKYFLIINIFLYHLQYNYKYNQVSAWICGGGAVDVRFINATIFSIGKLRENKCTFFCFKFFTKYPTKSTINFFFKKSFSKYKCEIKTVGQNNTTFKPK
jgi:hypothetical protein